MADLPRTPSRSRVQAPSPDWESSTGRSYLLSPGTQQLLNEVAAAGVTPRFTPEARTRADKFAVADPEWSKRKYQSFALVGNDTFVVSAPEPRAEPKFDQMSIAEQEHLLIDDLLTALVGIQGDYIRITDPSIGFSLPEGSDPALFEMVTKLIPLTNRYVQIRAFCAECGKYRSGMVAQALGSAMRALIKEYLVLIAQLEAQFLGGLLTLQKLWFYLQPSLQSLTVLGTVIDDILTTGQRGCRGGQLLSVVHNRAMLLAGDPNAKRICDYLLEKASLPYFEILDAWVRCGELRDPYQEFAVAEQAHPTSADGDQLWQHRHTLRGAQCPSFLQSVQNTILTSGKYVNAIRECGREPNQIDIEPIRYTTQNRVCVAAIERTHAHNSAQLLTLLFDDYQLMHRLRSLKHFLLLDQGDFFVHFMDAAETHLAQPREAISVNKLEAFLDLAVRASVNGEDPFRDDLSCELTDHTLLTQLLQIIHVDQKTGVDELSQAPAGVTGFDFFALSYKATWPVTLVLSHSTLAKYQILSRHFFQIKHLEWQISTTWTLFQTTKEFELGSTYKPLFFLRQKIYHFLQTVQYYVFVEVVEPRWRALEQRLKQVPTVDELIAAHNEFLDCCLNECMLTDPSLLRQLHKIMALCKIFADFTKKLHALSQQQVRSPTETPPRQSKPARLKSASAHAAAVAQDLRPTVVKYQGEFDQLVLMLIRKLTQRTKADPHLSNFLSRIDHNNYYVRQITTSSGAAK
eukprot:c17884_g1_i1.p1 GENE.c17884_g1_i1~~c17884_g1_i1.p1  ORF type:complete len:744 (+),score=185.64 c17884_g1_i1:32-2263(+)